MAEKIEAVMCRRVLIVEDDDATRDLLSRLMHGIGCDVRGAASVAEALSHLRAELPSHVLLDLMLPDADGAVLLRAVRRQRLKIRVALVTAAGRNSEAVTLAVLEKPDAVFHKPVEVEELERWVLSTPTEPASTAESRIVNVVIDVDLLARHLAEENGEPLTVIEVRQWLEEAGFTPIGDRWIVAERELGQLDPSEVLSVIDA